MGWVLNAVMIGFSNRVLPNHETKTRYFNILFWSTQLCVLCMTIAFWMQGYGLFSITFSTLHLFLAYAFFMRFLRFKQFKNNPFAIWTFLFFVLSTFGPLSLGFISTQGLAGSPIYKGAIYWFLHFSYNGWMTFALLYFIARDNELFETIKYKKLAHGLAVSVIATYVLSLLEFDLQPPWHVLGTCFALLQAVFAAIIARKVFQVRSVEFAHQLIKFATACFVLKTGMQVLSSFQVFQEIAFLNRDTLIFYLHLVFIGWISIGLLAAIFQRFSFQHKCLLKWSLYTLIIGFVLQESTLGISIVWIGLPTQVYSALTVLSAGIMALGSLLVLISLAPRDQSIIKI